MCMVSFITSPGLRQEPFQPTITTPYIPGAWPPLPPPQTGTTIVIEKRAAQEEYPWTRETFEEFKRIVALLKSLDERLGLKDCEDEAKQEWMRRVDARLAALEGPVHLDPSVA